MTLSARPTMPIQPSGVTYSSISGKTVNMDVRSQQIIIIRSRFLTEGA